MKIKKFFIAFYRLSRLNVILKDYFFPLTLASVIAAGFKVSILNFIIAALISLSIHTYSFIVNDCEDAEDDAMDPKKAKRNPISSGYITYKQGLLLLQLTAFPALFLGLLLYGFPSFLILLAATMTGHLYSWKRLRFKAYPFIDILSHCFALGMFQVLFFMLLPKAIFDYTGLVIMVGIGIFSIAGALYNQMRDYDVDVKSKLNNTAITIGKNNAKYLAILFYIVGVVMIVLGAVLRIFP